MSFFMIIAMGKGIHVMKGVDLSCMPSLLGPRTINARSVMK